MINIGVVSVLNKHVLLIVGMETNNYPSDRYLYNQVSQRMTASVHQPHSRPQLPSNHGDGLFGQSRQTTETGPLVVPSKYPELVQNGRRLSPPVTMIHVPEKHLL